ncbi:hypothetical protein GEMRC1_008428 [Eukaryota sp. GEM-RC1]
MDWEYSDFNEGVHDVPSELKKEDYNVFLEAHASQLLEFEKLLFEHSFKPSISTQNLLSVSFADSKSSDISYEDLINSDYITMDRPLIQFTELADTAFSLYQKAHTYFYPRLSLLIERLPSETTTRTNVKEGEAALDFSRTLPFYQELLTYSEKVTETASCLLQFLANLVANPKAAPLVAKSVLKYPYRLLGKLLSILASVDELISVDDIVADDINSIKRSYPLPSTPTLPISSLIGKFKKERIRRRSKKKL